MFRFKQFAIQDDRCAQKVGTDGVLLGAWARVEEARSILDIGAGSGLIALMVAQRNPQARVTGIEIVHEAALQAQENVAQSPFASRVTILEADVRDYSPLVRFDCILCNPPFFTEDTLSPDSARALARHAAMLDFDDLLDAVLRLLADEGIFHVILPMNACNSFTDKAFIKGLFAVRKCQVRTVLRKSPKRVMLSLSRQGSPSLLTEEIVLQDSEGNRSEAYAELAKDFYL